MNIKIVCACISYWEKLLAALRRKLHIGVCLIWQGKKRKRESDQAGHAGTTHTTTPIWPQGLATWAKLTQLGQFKKNNIIVFFLFYHFSLKSFKYVFDRLNCNIHIYLFMAMLAYKYNIGYVWMLAFVNVSYMKLLHVNFCQHSCKIEVSLIFVS